MSIPTPRAAIHLISLHVLLLAFTATQAAAVDGVVEINAAIAQKGGVTVGDAPGFPVSITQPGSYRLTSNLFAGTGIVVLAAEGVTIDLNGFRIDGGTGGGPGIQGGTGTTISNGEIVNFTGGFCLDLGDQSRVIDVRTANCVDGIDVGNYSLVLRSKARNHSMTGIRTGASSRIAESLSENNGGVGIATGAQSVVAKSIARNNGGAAGIGVGVRSAVIDSTAASGALGISVGTGSLVRGCNASSSGSDGLSAGDDSVVVNSAAANNTATGIRCGLRCTLRENAASNNTGDGFLTSDSSSLAHNNSSDNGGDGFDCDAATAGSTCGLVGNSAISNSAGVRLSTTTTRGSYKNSTLNGNTTDVVPNGKNVPTFQNYCSGVFCP